MKHYTFVNIGIIDPGIYIITVLSYLVPTCIKLQTKIFGYHSSSCTSTTPQQLVRCTLIANNSLYVYYLVSVNPNIYIMYHR
jgi:hypothetical protein